MAKYYRFNLKGELIIEKVFDEISYAFGKNKEFIPVRKGKKWGVAINESLETVIPIQYDLINFISYNESILFAVKENDNLFYIDINNKVVIDSKYSFITNTLFGITSENGLNGVVNKEGKIIIEPKYINIKKLGDNRFLLKEENGFLLANESGNIISNKIFADRIVDKAVKINNKWITNYFLIIKNEKLFGVLDGDFNTVLECKYDDYINFTNNETFFAELNGINFVIDNKNNIIKEFDFTFNFWSEYLLLNGKYYYIIRKDKSYGAKFGILNEKFDLIVPFEYDWIDYSNEVWKVRKGRSEYILDKNFNLIINSKYKRIGKFEQEGIACVQDDNLKYKFIDRNSKVISEKIFDSVLLGSRSLLDFVFTNINSKYKSGLCGVCVDSKWGYIDLTGNLKIDCKYEQISEFDLGGYAIVKINSKWGVIDQNDNIILDFKYENIDSYSLNDKLIIIKKEELYGMIDFDNNELIPFSFSKLNFNHFGFIEGYSKKPIALRKPVQKELVPINLLNSNMLEKHNTLIHNDLIRVMVMAIVSGEVDDLSNRLYIIDIVKKDNNSATFISGYAGGGVWDECTFINEVEYKGEEGGFTVFDYIRDDEVIKDLVSEYICEVDEDLDEYQYKSLNHFVKVGEKDLKLLYSVWYNDSFDYSEISKNDKKRFKKLLKSTGGIWWKDWDFKF